MTSITWKGVAYWVLAVLLAAFFLFAGRAKLSGSPAQAASFTGWGYPEWFLYAVGVIEAVGAVGLLVPRVAGLAALLLAGTMVGAAVTHFVHGEGNAVPVPLVLLALLAGVAYAQRARLRGLLSWLFRARG